MSEKPFFKTNLKTEITTNKTNDILFKKQNETYLEQTPK